MNSEADSSAKTGRGTRSSDQTVTTAVEAALFDALERVFQLERNEALRLSHEAYGAIASHLADVSAQSNSPAEETQAMAQFDEMQGELEELKRQLNEFVAARASTED